MDRKRMWARVISFASALLLFAVGGVIYYYRESQNYKRIVDNRTQQSFSDLSASVYNISTTLQKGIYANTPPQISGLAAKLWKESGVAKSSLNSLPLSDTRVDTVVKYLSQVGDYAMYLSKLSTSGQPMKEEDRQHLLSLSQYSDQLAGQLSSLQSDIVNDSGSVYGLLMQTGTGDSESPNIIDGFKDTEDGFSDFPTLIYDGPFSDHILQMTPRITVGMSEATRETARQRAMAVLGVSSEDLMDESDEESNMPTYNFKSGDSVVSVTKKGALLCYLLTSREVSDYNLDIPTAIAKAESTLRSLGYESLSVTYYETRSGVVTVNFAAVQNGVICYPDLIKVGIALDDGSVVMLDARGYLLNHHPRVFPSGILSEASARTKLSPLLTVQKWRMAVIPTSGLNEVYCYEYLCMGSNGEKVLVYLNTSTGYEEQILILLEQEDSVLTI